MIKTVYPPIYPILFFVFFFGGKLYAQNDNQNSDAVPSESLRQWDQLRISGPNRNVSEPHYNKINRSIEITPHILIIDSDTMITQAQVAELINRTNDFFKPIGLSFTVCGFRYFRESAFHGSSFAWWDANTRLTISKYYEPYTINMYFVDSLKTGDYKRKIDYIGGAAPLPAVDPSLKSDFVFISRGGQTAITIGHELGHFFGLYHPHESRYGLELVSETNCSKAGDLICDTPAEPKESLLEYVDGNCHYTGNFKNASVDPMGQGYLPSVSNIMSYIPEACVKGFTVQQLERMVDVYYGFKTYLR